MVFCDWLSIYEEHPSGGLPRINDGCIWAVSPEGEILWTTERKFEHVGSYDTMIRIKCDGYRVTLDGNVGRYNRSDNVFGYTVSQCIGLANVLLASFGIPSFTSPQFNPNLTRRPGERIGGASITRVDLTCNYSAGSPKKAVRVLHFLAGQDTGRRASVKDYGANGCTWNEGSKYWYLKAYNKAESLGEYASDQLRQLVNESGVVRLEVSLKSRYLKQKALYNIHDWAMKEGNMTMDNVVFNRFSEVLTRGAATRSEIEDIPKRLGHIAVAWRSGVDIMGDPQYAVSTKRRWRHDLLAYGIDIKQPSKVTRLPIRLEVIQLVQLEAPAWYWNQAA